MQEGWTHTPLKEVCTDFIVPQRDKPPVFDGDIPWCRIEDIEGKYLNGSKSSQCVTRELADSMNMRLCPKGTVICACSASIGNQAITTVECYTNQTFIGIVVNPNALNNEYLYWFLSSKKEVLESMGRGATIKYISRNKFENLIIPLPSLSRQESIVAELDLLSGILDKQKVQLKQLDAFALSIFYDMFGSPVDNDKKWTTKPICNIGTVVTGSTPSTSNNSNWDGKVNWVTPAELGEQLYYGETVRKITENAARRLTLMPVGTVLLSSRAPIGKLAITTEPMCCNQGFKNIICGKAVNNVFLYYYLKFTMDRIQALGRGATFKEVSKQSICAYPVIVPPIDLQKSFATKIEAIEHQKNLINQSIVETQKLFDYTMDKYFG